MDLRLWICTRPWSRLPAPIWALVASPALRWAMGGGRWFCWPADCSRSPLRLSFWWVGAVESDFWADVRSYVFDPWHCVDGRPLPPDRLPWLFPVARVWLAGVLCALDRRVPAWLD